MKKETKGKFTLEKFEIAKLNIMRTINGGDDGSSVICTTTNTNDPDSSRECRDPRHDPRQPAPNIPNIPNRTNNP
ncbi:hypothetical protein LXD69_03150 [Flavobacterium sediminilitoris]|uniref:Natural product n=1 Tax=Flavobacterium sediminilitoris TaxID=2024526 RepID=A0ABY4HQL5_9FLAO|nr:MULTISPECIES: hypothetical protein [Flavobacterium]UOX34516.1 hypothetical protein LXD69_03150 [Flavobacterium sediminilitoris]